MKSRFALLTTLSYLVPLLFFALFLFNSLPTAIGFWTLSIGWFLMACGTLLIFIAALQYENELLQKNPGDPDLLEEVTLLRQQLQESKRKPKDCDPDLKSKLSDLTLELENARKQGLDHLQDKEKLVAELQNTITRQKKMIEEKEIILSKFQNKITELTYEIKSLVLSPSEESISLSKPNALQESSIILKRCITLAQQHTGAWSFNPRMSRGSDLSIDSYALDQRRFYQALSREKGGVIFLYSPKEEKVLYVSQSVKSLLNIAPESFIQDFPRWVDSKFTEAVKSLATTQQTQVNLKQYPCQLGIIPTGLFKNHILGIVPL